MCPENRWDAPSRWWVGGSLCLRWKSFWLSFSWVMLGWSRRWTDGDSSSVMRALLGSVVVKKKLSWTAKLWISGPGTTQTCLRDFVSSGLGCLRVPHWGRERSGFFFWTCFFCDPTTDKSKNRWFLKQLCHFLDGSYSKQQQTISDLSDKH